MKKPEYCTDEIMNYFDSLEKSKNLYNLFIFRLRIEFKHLIYNEAFDCFLYWFTINRNRKNYD